MQRILILESSPKTDSFSRAGTAALIARLAIVHSNAPLLRRDLGMAPPPHVDAGFDRAMRLPVEARTPADHAALALSEELIGELEATDGLVIGTPMHNYTVPSCLKAWIDHVVRPRRSFGFGPQGKFGLLADRPTYIVTASGGPHGGVGEQPDFLVPYLRAILATIGITSLQVLSLQSTTRQTTGQGDAMTPLAGWLDAVLPTR